MSILDIILLVFLGGFVVSGFWFGLIHTFGALCGTIVGAAVASRFYSVVAETIQSITGGSLNAIKVITFILLFVLIARLVGYLFHIVEGIYDFISVIPFLKTINRLGGAIFGLVEGGLVIGLSLYFAELYPFSAWLTKMILEQSVFAGYFLAVAKVLMPLLPEAVQELQARLF
jgi:membrane protein required for colicin V production